MGAALDAATRFFDEFARGDLAAADEVFADDCRYKMPTGSLNKAEHRAMGEAFKAGLPDARMVVDHVLDGGDEVFIEGRFVGIHSGDLHSPEGTIPATGNPIDMRFGDYFKVTGGKVTEHRTYWD